MLGCLRETFQYILKISHPQKFYFAHKICIVLVPTLPFLVTLLPVPSIVMEESCVSWLPPQDLHSAPWCSNTGGLRICNLKKKKKLYKRFWQTDRVGQSQISSAFKRYMRSHLLDFSSFHTELSQFYQPSQHLTLLTLQELEIANLKAVGCDWFLLMHSCF